MHRTNAATPDDAEHEAEHGAVDPAADRLCKDHLHLVDHALRQYMARAPRHTDRDEMWGAGAAGLVEASRRFDPSIGASFATYALPRIRGAMLDAARSIDWASRGTRRHMRAIARKHQELAQANGASPSSIELADALDMTLDELDSHRSAALAGSVLHLHQPTGEGGQLLDLVADEGRQRAPEEQLEHRELVGTLLTALDHLPEVQRDVLVRHFFDGELYCDIAASMGVTEARVSQLRAEAVNALRAYLGGQYEGVEEVPDGAPGVRRRAAFLAELAASASWSSRIGAADAPPAWAAS